MEDVAVNRLATSIAQLTLCQVTTDEIYAATKLLDKACQKLRGIPYVLNDLAEAMKALDGKRNSEVSLTSHLRESLTLRLPYVNYVN